MNLVVPNVGECELLDKMLKDALSVDESFTLKLYQNNYTPLVISVAGDFTEATFTDYTAKTLARTSWSAATIVRNRAQSTYATQTWTCGASGNTIYGYYIIGATSGTLLWAERFNEPTILTNGQTISFSLSFYLTSELATVDYTKYIYPSGIATANAFGTAEVSTPWLLIPSGIATANAFGTATVSTPSSLLTGLVAYYKMDETSGSRSDSGGSGYTISQLNGTTTSTTGKISNAAVFSSGPYLNNTNTAFTLTTDFAVSSWINATSIAGSAEGQGWCANVANDATGQWMCGAKTNGTVICGTWTAGTGTSRSTPSSTITTGAWYHIVYQRASGTHEIWVNGVSQSLTTSSLSGGWGNSKLNVGCSWIGYTWNGSVDELGIWSRVLTNGEIATLYNSGTGVTHPF